MSESVWLSESAVLKDLHNFVTRLKALNAGGLWLRLAQQDGAVYLRAASGLLTAETLLERTPTIIAERAFKLEQSLSHLDAVYEISAIAERLAKMLRENSLELILPAVEVGAVWAAIAPPKSGWQPVGTVAKESLAAVGKEVALRTNKVLPEKAGQAVVQKARAQIWQQQMLPELPAGAALIAETLGFLTADARLLAADNWRCLVFLQGTVFVKNPNL